MLEIQYFIVHAYIMFTESVGRYLQQQESCVYSLLKVGQQALTLGLLRGLEDRPVDAPLTERDL